MKKRLMTIIGARPQFIKAATISRELKGYAHLEEILVHTGQHYDAQMSDVFFDELQMSAPTYMLDVHGGNHGQMTGRMLESIEKCLLQEKPNAVLVYGDTNSTLAGSLAAIKLNIPVIHIEAGLRSFNRSMPEEINRILTDHMSSLLFCPTQSAVNNLSNEGIKKGVYHTGDVMYDATLYAINQVKDSDTLKNKFKDISNEFALLTVHRAEATQSVENIQRIINYVLNFSELNNLQVLFTVHPRARVLIEKLPSFSGTNIKLLEPLSYLEMQYLLTRAQYVLTDSGGLQKEAYFHGVPCITLRSETEWTETIDAGWNRLWTVEEYKNRKSINEYGNGKAAQEICRTINEWCDLI